MVLYLYLVTRANPQCRKSLLRHTAFWKTGELFLLVLNFRLTREGHLVLNIPVWSTDSYSSTVVPTKQFAPSVLSWLVWRRKVLTAFPHNFAWDQIFLYLCLSRLNQLFWYSWAKAITSSLEEVTSKKSRLLTKISYFNYRLLTHPTSSLANGKSNCLISKRICVLLFDVFNGCSSIKW